MEQEQDKVTWKLRFLQVGNTLGNGALNFGKGALNILSPLALSLPSRTPGANTMAEELAKAHRGAIAGALDKTLWGKAINILDGVGGATLGRTSATETGNFVTDGLNGFVSSMPILSTALAPLGKTIDVYSSDRQKRSLSFNRQSTAMKNNGANVLFNGSTLQAEGNLESIRNVQAEQNLKLGDLDNAADALAVWHRQDMKLRGGPNRVNNFGVTGGKQGTVLLFTKKTLSKHKIKKLQDGGKVQLRRTLDELVDYVEQQNPPFWERMSGQDKNYIPSPDGQGYSTLIMSWSTGDDGMAEVYPQVLYDNTTHHLKYIQDWREALNLARQNGDVIIMTPEEAENFTTNYKKASKLKHIYNSVLPLYTETFNGIYKEGGKVNVIPSGALHAHKHNLTEIAEDGEKFEDVTTKGIPVVVEDEKGNLIQQAVVEREEIIFRLEVTKKLEELSKKHTDEAAIEAGKLLVKEILYNTKDNTGEML